MMTQELQDCWQWWDEKRTAVMLDCLAVQWVIYINGGMATKSAVEDVVMPLHDVERDYVHTCMNDIEYFALNTAMTMNRRWDNRYGDVPKLESYPAIVETRIRWGKAGCPKL